MTYENKIEIRNNEIYEIIKILKTVVFVFTCKKALEIHKIKSIATRQVSIV